MARDGGEEFAVVLPGLDGGAAERVGEQIRRTVASRRAECHGVSLALTLSMGIGELSAEGAHASPAALVRAADAALYRAKAEGRDRVCRHPVPVA
ncbi:MAG: diguanylate cyclase [Xanthomonadales bacterium]|nr:diguanylate cyclase [Xanthomonadales bacterium]